MRIASLLLKKMSQKKFWSPVFISGTVVVIAFFLTRCFDIISFEQPETAIAGETISIKLDIKYWRINLILEMLGALCQWLDFWHQSLGMPGQTQL